MDPVTLVSEALTTKFCSYQLCSSIRGIHIQHKDKPIISPWKNSSDSAFSGAAYSFKSGFGPGSINEIIDWSNNTTIRYKNQHELMSKMHELVDSGNYYFTRNVYLANWPSDKELNAQNWAEEYIKQAVKMFGSP